MINSDTLKSTYFAHVELRPIFDYGDRCVVSSIYDADYFGAYAAPAGEPACRVACFDEAGEALDCIFTLPEFAPARRWYNGNEICVEITSKDDVFRALADIYCGDDNEYAELGEKLGYDAEKIAALTEAVKARGHEKGDTQEKPL